MPRGAFGEVGLACELVQHRRGLFNQAAEDARDKKKDENASDKNHADHREHAERTPKEFTELRFDHWREVLLVYHV